MTLDMVLGIIGFAGFVLIAINGLRPTTQPSSEIFYDPRQPYGLPARAEEVHVENEALRALLRLDEQPNLEGSVCVPKALMSSLPQYAQSYVECGVGSVLLRILTVRRFFGESFPDDLKHFDLTPTY